MAQHASAQDVLHFWFEELEPGQWFRQDAELDRRITARFATLHEAAARCELWAWRETPPGRLAEIIVLDQFSRNIHRDSAQAFSQDPLALALAQEAVAQGDDTHLPPGRRSFLYMPFMHSESPLIHVQAEALFAAPGLESQLEYELAHKRIIDRFGRYPHRNAALGRQSTAEELAFLRQPGSGF